MKRCSVLARWTRMFTLLICVVVLYSWGCTWYVPPSEPTFEIRDIADSTSTVKHVLKDQEGNNVVVGDTVFFSRADLENVTADKNPEGTGSALNFTWNANCADRWTRYTASRVGKRIVIIADDIVLATPKILDPIKKPGIMLSLPETDLRKAKKMAAELSPMKR
jgi:preprotein translocase subunit SecD